jgi:hypothetical protein
MAGTFYRRRGKELLVELVTMKEKEATVLNMVKVRSDVRARFTAVGIFMTVLTVRSEQLMQTMRRVWKLRGIVNTNLDDCLGREFVHQLRNEEATEGREQEEADTNVAFEALHDHERQDSSSLDFVVGGASKSVIDPKSVEDQLDSHNAQSKKEVQSSPHMKVKEEDCEEVKQGTREDTGEETAGMKSGTDEGAWQDQ